MLSNMDYEDLKLDDKVHATTDNNLDMNNILENDELILDVEHDIARQWRPRKRKSLM